MHNASLKIVFAVILAAGASPAFGQPSRPDATEALSVSQAIDKMVANEASLTEEIRSYHPLVETYLQNLDNGADLGFHPSSDHYFLGKLDFGAKGKEHSLLKDGGFLQSITTSLSQFYSVNFLPGGFASMLVIDGHFDKANYDFEYVRREFLGDVKTAVFDVQPKKASKGTFKGRIWAEDRDYNIVRFNGTYGPSTASKMYAHFDSWREYMGPALWLPAYVYTEESDAVYMGGVRHLRFKGQTRLWGYNIGKTGTQNESTALIVDSDEVKDRADQSEGGITPVGAFRAWERTAEDNIIQRMERAALLAPDGEVNKIIETVATNLEITNNLDIEPPVRARMLLTSPLESFTIGHTIVLSRGLVDVLPDEASLAMIVAHELAHIALGHRLDTRYAFSDSMIFEDPEAFQRVQLKRGDKEEADADKKAAEFLKNSPYKDKLGNAGLFLEAVDARARQLNHLLLPHVGNAMVKGGQVRRMAELKQGAPKLELRKIDQIAALPLGSRVRVDPWSANAELIKAKPVALLSADEKMPFEVTPVFLYLTRQTGSPSESTAQTAR